MKNYNITVPEQTYYNENKEHYSNHITESDINYLDTLADYYRIPLIIKKIETFYVEIPNLIGFEFNPVFNADPNVTGWIFNFTPIFSTEKTAEEYKEAYHFLNNTINSLFPTPSFDKNTLISKGKSYGFYEFDSDKLANNPNNRITSYNKIIENTNKILHEDFKEGLNAFIEKKEGPVLNFNNISIPFFNIDEDLIIKSFSNLSEINRFLDDVIYQQIVIEKMKLFDEKNTFEIYFAGEKPVAYVKEDLLFEYKTDKAIGFAGYDDNKFPQSEIYFKNDYAILNLIEDAHNIEESFIDKMVSEKKLKEKSTLDDHLQNNNSNDLIKKHKI